MPLGVPSWCPRWHSVAGGTVTKAVLSAVASPLPSVDPPCTAPYGGRAERTYSESRCRRRGTVLLDPGAVRGIIASSVSWQARRPRSRDAQNRQPVVVDGGTPSGRPGGNGHLSTTVGMSAEQSHCVSGPSVSTPGSRTDVAVDGRQRGTTRGKRGPGILWPGWRWP